MPATVFANSRFVPSYHRGHSVGAFPDVCKTPAEPSPIPLPYPNSAAPGAPSTAASKAAFKQTRALQLRGHLQGLHSQLASLSSGNPTRWHKLLDDYVIVSAELYKTLSE